jgi:biopolymer transport protein ExbB/TolQ
MVELELHKTDLQYTNLRYLSWVLPTIGFFGTVIGIANALEFMMPVLEAENAAAAMQPVVMSLSSAFNTTIVALFLNAILVFLVQRTQQQEEDAINKSSEYCLRNLINRLYVPLN